VIGWDKGLVGDIPTLPEVLGYYGYTTGGFTIDAPSGFRPDYGLDRGFQHLEIIDPPRDTPDGRHRNGEVGPGGASAGPAARWIQKQAPDAPLFVMLHTRSAHFPFVLEDDPSDKTGVTSALWSTGHQQTRAQTLPGHAGGTAQQGVVTLARDPAQEAVRAAGEAGLAMWKQRYAEAVHRTDRDIAVMVEALKAAGRWDRTVLLVVADHGESLGDHGELLHGDAYFDGVVHIPLLLRVPGLKPQQTSALASHVDIAPTLLDLVGAVPPADADGASIVPVLRGERADIRTTALVEGGVARQKAGPPRGAVISGPWALLRQDMGCPDGGGGPPPPGSPGLCLYNLHEDPGQTKNVAAAHPEVVTDLLGRWDAFRAAKATEARQLDLDPTFVESLQKSGYDFREEKTP
jgi:arylsulfatase A-like enzyme